MMSTTKLRTYEGPINGNILTFSLKKFDFRVIFISYKLWLEISNNLGCATSKGSDHPAYTHKLIRDFAGRLNIL